jgi:hypothetical protein
MQSWRVLASPKDRELLWHWARLGGYMHGWGRSTSRWTRAIYLFICCASGTPFYHLCTMLIVACCDCWDLDLKLLYDSCRLGLYL